MKPVHPGQFSSPLRFASVLLCVTRPFLAKAFPALFSASLCFVPKPEMNQIAILGGLEFFCAAGAVS